MANERQAKPAPHLDLADQTNNRALSPEEYARLVAERAAQGLPTPCDDLSALRRLAAILDHEPPVVSTAPRRQRTARAVGERGTSRVAS